MVMSTHAMSSSRESRDVLHVTLWSAQIVLFLVFSLTGLAKLTSPINELAPMMPWVLDVPLTLVRFIGAAELAGALGVLLPALTRVRPQLTPLAALGLTVVMALATVVHLARGEFVHALIPLGLGFLAAFVAWGRYARAPIQDRIGISD
jgi:putative oxidoreductase